MLIQKSLVARMVLAGLVASVSACTTVALVPGADGVKLTRNNAEVVDCKAAGNVSGEVKLEENTIYLEAQLRNQAVGLGANTVLLTTSSPKLGVAYQCR